MSDILRDTVAEIRDNEVVIMSEPFTKAVCELLLLATVHQKFEVEGGEYCQICGFRPCEQYANAILLAKSYLASRELEPTPA